jgi:hypothetical protein
MHTTAEVIYEQLKNAPDGLVEEVGDFTEFLIKKYQPNVKKAQTSSTLDSFKGLLKNSPAFEGDPLEIQQRMRNDWD